MKKLLFFVMLYYALPGSAQKRITVSPDGSGDFKTVQAAINAVPDNSTDTTVIYLKPSTYKEKLILSKSKINVKLVGEEVSTTVITFDDFASKTDSSGRNLGTSRTSSFYIYAAGFTAENITFENSAGPVGQAVAVFVDADRVCFYNCRFLGFQDTLYTHGKGGTREYYKDCYIEGTTDFIFGSATALFEGCELYCRRGGSHITAASTADTTTYGYVFINCKVTGNASLNSFDLGRPWRPYAKTVYLNCEIGPMIKPVGWQNWNGTESYKTAYYAEYKNTGEGYKPAYRVSWSHQLTDAEAEKYTPSKILRGWIPPTK